MKGLLFILSAPSGVGKSTLAKAIVKKDRRFSYCVTYTTRRARKNEKEGQDYHFVNKKQFRKLIKEKCFLEHANVHGAFYATPKVFVQDALRRGRYLILAIDVQGAHRISKIYPSNTIKIFVLPPDIKTWFKRLKQRNEKNWKRRMKNAKKELLAIASYHHTLINEQLSQALKDFFAIVRLERRKRRN